MVRTSGLKPASIAAAGAALLLMHTAAAVLDLVSPSFSFAESTRPWLVAVSVLVASTLSLAAVPRLAKTPYTRLAKVGIFMLACLGAFVAGIIVSFAHEGIDVLMARILFSFWFLLLPGALIALLGGGVIGAFVFKRSV